MAFLGLDLGMILEFENFINEFYDRVVNLFVLGIHGRSFAESNIKPLGKLLSFTKLYSSFVVQISFVANDQNLTVFPCNIFDILNPVLKTIK
jgi:hypothetical protein